MYAAFDRRNSSIRDLGKCQCCSVSISVSIITITNNTTTTTTTTTTTNTNTNTNTTTATNTTTTTTTTTTTIAMSVIATSPYEDGPFLFKRSFYPDGNETRDQVTYINGDQPVLGR